MRKVLPEKPGTAVIHSDLSQFRSSDRHFKRQLLSSILSLVEGGWTLLFPSFTFSFCSGSIYQKFNSKSETGILADLVFENISSAQRTNHPIYSFVVLGENSDSILACESETVFGNGSPFEYLEVINASVVMLGCDFNYCTQFHRYEELNRVDYRTYKVFKGLSDVGHGEHFVEVKMYVRNLDLGPENDWSPVIQELVISKAINEVSVFGGIVSSARIKDIQKVCNEQLGQNPLIYLSNSNEVAKKIEDKNERNIQSKIKISIFSHKNVDIISAGLKEQINDHIPDQNFEVSNPPYGQMYASLIDNNSSSNSEPPFVKIFCDRLEDIPGFHPDNFAQSLDSVKRYVELISDYHHSVGGWIIINRFALLKPPTIAQDMLEETKLYARANDILMNKFNTSEQVAWVDVGAEIVRYGGVVLDRRLEFLGNFAWSEEFSRHLSYTWTSLLISMLGKDTRLIVVDLDNTLWGGVLGEDGISGLKLGGDYPGNAFKAFQLALIEHSKRGVALSVVSKNDQDLALKAMSNLPDMIIQKSHLQAYEINWEPKWKNIIKIAKELNLGLGSILFIDDNPVERELVRRNLPHVKVLPLSSDPTEYVDILDTSPYLRAVRTTKEDMGRLKEFSSRNERKNLHEKAANLTDFYKSLDIKLRLNALETGNALRAAQLCVKTNQFNTTTLRYDQTKLFNLQSEGHDVIVISYEDNFSPAENIGVIILRYGSGCEAIIDLYLLSCRVLGRGIETIIPKLVMGIALEKGYKILNAKIVETARNTPSRDVYKKSGFLKGPKNIWYSELSMQEIPSWIDYKINL